jgi:uncharacterized RDD family membrane protein YckC
MPNASDVALDLTVPNLTSGVKTVTGGAAFFDGATSVRVDHFVVDRKIGAGGMGAIYAARDVALDRPVALKVLPESLAREPGAHERFIREAQAQARLSSPHVVQIFYIGRLAHGSSDDDGSPLPAEAAPRGSLYFAMELVDGESLAAILERGATLEPEQARRLMVQTANGLDAAAAAGLVHRDVKPANLLVGRAGNLKIADFGLAKSRDQNPARTGDGAIMGTPYYMAPEQAMGRPLDLRADMYALGCSFYHLLAGEAPFDGPNHVVVLAQHMNAEARPLRELRKEVPAALADIIARLMRKAPHERYASYADLVFALEQAAPTHVEPAGFGARAVAMAFDGIVTSVLIGALGWVGLVISVVYATLAQAYFGQTLAKYVLRIRVERQDGARLGVARSLARLVVSMWLPCWFGIVALSKGFATFTSAVGRLSELGAAKELILPLVMGNLFLALVYGAGLLLAAFDPLKRAAHDRLLGTRVVYALGHHRPKLLPRTGAGP